MKILSHRGYWKTIEEKNSVQAFKRSFELGFGTETDIRDHEGRIVIAHDMPDGSAMGIEDFFRLYTTYKNELTLALNVKADGLQELVMRSLSQHGIINYFFFDMSVPDALGYWKRGLRFFTRQSEYEMEPHLYSEAQWIWLDEFNSHWINEQVIRGHIDAGKEVCIVSPDLHRRDYHKEWEHYREIINKFNPPKLMLCTDHPEEAQKFFN